MSVSPHKTRNMRSCVCAQMCVSINVCVLRRLLKEPCFLAEMDPLMVFVEPE